MLTYILILLVVILGSACGWLAYERIYRKTQASRSTLYVDALKDLLDGREEAAFAKLRQVVSSDSSNLDAYLRLGQILREHKYPDRALQVHKDLTLRSGMTTDQKVAVLRQLALDYQDLNEPTTARAALEELISLDSRNHWAHTRLLRLLEEAADWDAAYDLAVATLKLESNKSKKPLAYYKYCASLQLLKRREFHKARIILKEALGLDPTLADAYVAIGDSYQAEERFEDAVSFWNKLIQTVPDRSHLVIERLKKTLFELGRFGDIIEICQNILNHDPKNLQARRTLAEFHHKKGDLDSALEILEQIIEDVPDDLPTVLELIRSYQERGDKRKIEDLLRTLGKRSGQAAGSTRRESSTPVGQ